jgi:manganese efflux pump family protein
MVLELVVLGAVIGANNFATSLALGAMGQAGRRWRIIGAFTLFEFFVPLLGIWLGSQVAASIEESWSFLGPALIALIGVWTLATVAGSGDEEKLARRVSSWGGLFLLAGTLAIDNLVISFSLGLAERSPLLIAAVIALFSASFAWVGLRVGSVARRRWHRTGSVGSGLLLIALSGAMALGWL